jgi:hypothetical protein
MSRFVCRAALTVARRTILPLLCFGMAATLPSQSAPRPSPKDTARVSIREHGDTAWMTKGDEVTQFIARRDTVFVARIVNGVTKTSDAWIVTGDKARRVRDGAAAPALAIVGYQRILRSIRNVDAILSKAPRPPL